MMKFRLQVFVKTSNDLSYSVWAIIESYKISARNFWDSIRDNNVQLFLLFPITAVLQTKIKATITFSSWYS